MIIRITAILIVTFLFSCSGAKEAREYEKKAQNPEFLHQGIKAITDRIVHDIFSPPVASRIYTYVTVAAYEAIIHQDTTYKTLAGQLHGLTPFPQPDPKLTYCYSLASSQAMLKVGRTLVFSEKDLDVYYNTTMKAFKDAGVPDDVYDRSVEFGNQIAEHVMAWSAKDNYKQSRTFPKYTVQNDLASWKPTPPAYMEAVEPHWNKIRTFVLDSASQWKPAPAIAFSTDKSSQFFKEAKEVYEVGKGLDIERRTIARFWDCNPFAVNVKGHVMFATKKISPGGHWINITRLACREVHADIVRSAEAYVRVSLALVDGFISCWDEKYHSKVIRPETYINQYIDENWLPLLQTPPFPEYTSGHSVVSNAASVTLTNLFGDNFAYADSTETEFGLAPRKFKSFFDASDEAAISRLYGGIHYRAACEVGATQGREVGKFILGRVHTHATRK